MDIAVDTLSGFVESVQVSSPAPTSPTWGGQLPAAANTTDLGGSLGSALEALGTGSLSAGCHASTALLRKCSSGCFSKGAGHARSDCISACLVSTHLEQSCASCYGHRSDCTISSCMSPCVRSATGSACTSCVHSHCGGSCR